MNLLNQWEPCIQPLKEHHFFSPCSCRLLQECGVNEDSPLFTLLYSTNCHVTEAPQVRNPSPKRSIGFYSYFLLISCTHECRLSPDYSRLPRESAHPGPSVSLQHLRFYVFLGSDLSCVTFPCFKTWILGFYFETLKVLQ